MTQTMENLIKIGWTISKGTIKDQDGIIAIQAKNQEEALNQLEKFMR